MQNYLQTVETQYRQSPTMLQWLQAFNDWIDPSNDINTFYNNVWNLDTAIGWGLDVWGRIVGVSRNVSVPTFGIYTLSDAAFYNLINAKALANISDGSIPSLNNILMTLFPNRGDCYVVDSGGMACTVHLVHSYQGSGCHTSGGISPAVRRGGDIPRRLDHIPNGHDPKRPIG
jgi:hypothetical protein